MGSFNACTPYAVIAMAMPKTAAYQPDLAQYVVDHWPAASPLRIPLARLGEVLSIAFQASLTSEEARVLRFRLLLTESDALPASGTPNVAALPLRFERRLLRLLGNWPGLRDWLGLCDLVRQFDRLACLSAPQRATHHQQSAQQHPRFHGISPFPAAIALPSSPSSRRQQQTCSVAQ